jgi:peptidoglycan LD-endopeptidase LytH
MLKKILCAILIMLLMLSGIWSISRFSIENIIIPVAGAIRGDYNQNSFGAPRVGHTHKGVDIFAKKGTPVVSATHGIVIYTGVLSLGGNVILIISPGLRFYYYAHLDEIKVQKFAFVASKDVIGTVGKTGNAKYTPAHLHFSISRISHPFEKRFINPVPLLNEYVKNK